MKPESQHDRQDVLQFFGEKTLELSLFETLRGRMADAIPGMTVRVQKSQISFYGRHLFGAASLPIRRRKDWPERCLVVTVGLSHPLDSPRVAVRVEPYPNRWTHHILIERPEQIDEELLGWLVEAYEFAESKR